ncbi:hypothetical protein CJP16_02305 [Aeromonas sobria]|uniref:Uncharacterized protein n=1 Tax=Aeromonas sobria TaxID=646 RepID=A0A2N3J7E0_AERSO|nr:hypothetical protein CJP16_02305 [Aeromonas sobria]
MQIGAFQVPLFLACHLVHHHHLAALSVMKKTLKRPLLPILSHQKALNAVNYQYQGENDCEAPVHDI